MPEYINREAALKELNKNSITKKLTLANGVSIFDTIKNIPTADVVEVVRCKDCQHARQTVYGNYHCLVDHRLAHEETDYCSFGVKKEGAGE